MFLTRSCAARFAHGAARPPAAWVRSRAVGTALPWAQGAASHHKQHPQKAAHGWAGASSALCALPLLCLPWPPRCCSRSCAQLEQAASSRNGSSGQGVRAAPGDEPMPAWADQLTPACRRGPCEGLGGKRGSAGLRNSSEMFMPSSDAPAL